MDGTTERGWSRREFLAVGALSTVALASGCATNPVTGRRRLMLIGREGEIGIDRQYLPHQVSADYGVFPDKALNAYVDERGHAVAAAGHRPEMPYSFRAVNASHVNAYAFPGGSIAVTRGLLLEMENEAELAALLGHEIGHVAARHTARRMTSGILAQVLVLGVAVAAGSRDEDAGLLVAGLGAVGAGLLLARYSRANEREADALGMDYAVGAGYPAEGMIGLHAILMRLSQRRPNAIERMFASHPMSEARHATATRRAATRHAEAADRADRRARYMDLTAPVRAQADAIRACQDGDREAARGNPDAALAAYTEALRARPDDYEALLKSARVHLARDRAAEAQRLARAAREALPDEPQAVQVIAMADLARRRYAEARDGFNAYEQALPGQPETVFFLGRSEEGLGRRAEAAAYYRRYLASGARGANADHARARLAEWEPNAAPARG